MGTIETDNLENFMNEMRAFLDKKHWEECRGPSAMRELQNLKILFERASRAVEDVNAAVESARETVEAARGLVKKWNDGMTLNQAKDALFPMGNMDECSVCGHPRVDHGITYGCDRRWDGQKICLCPCFREPSGQSE